MVDAESTVDNGPYCQSISADELLEKLSPACAIWQPNPASWIYRGHADSTWELLARAHRPGAYNGLCVPPEILKMEPDWNCRQNSELWMLSTFRRALDDAGLPIPIEAPNPKQVGSTYTYGTEAKSEAWPMLALAQHYGLPTSLLDWTRRSRVAAYFAAIAAVELPPDGSMDVWALRGDYLEARRHHRSDHGELQVFLAPRSSNPNLHAQSGVFTVLRGCETPVTVDTYMEQDVAEGLLGERQLRDYQLPLIRRLTLPRTEAPKLLRLLSHEGITGASMFPGYAGVVQALYEHGKWDKLPPHEKWRSWD